MTMVIGIIDTVVICPDNMFGDSISVTFNSFDFGAFFSNDSLSIYDGEVDPGNLIGTFAGTTIPGPFTSTNLSGCLSFVLDASNSIFSGEPGWEASINCLPTTCSFPSMLNVSNITSTSADLGWTDNAGAFAWQVEWDTVGFIPGTGTIVPAGTNPLNISGLIPNTEYCFFVRAICSLNDSSIVRGPFCFTTSCFDVDLGNDTMIVVDCNIINPMLTLDAGITGTDIIYNWSTGDSTQTIIVDTNNMDSIFVVTVTDTVSGCSATDMIFVDIDCVTGVGENGNNVSLSIFPNPNKGVFTLLISIM